MKQVVVVENLEQHIYNISTTTSKDISGERERDQENMIH